MIQPDLRDWKNSQEALEYKADLHLLLGRCIGRDLCQVGAKRRYGQNNG